MSRNQTVFQWEERNGESIYYIVITSTMYSDTYIFVFVHMNVNKFIIFNVM